MSPLHYTHKNPGAFQALDFTLYVSVCPRGLRESQAPWPSLGCHALMDGMDETLLIFCMTAALALLRWRCDKLTGKIGRNRNRRNPRFPYRYLALRANSPVLQMHSRYSRNHKNIERETFAILTSNSNTQQHPRSDDFRSRHVCSRRSKLTFASNKMREKVPVERQLSVARANPRPEPPLLATPYLTPT